jgi:hypothetical protein
MEIKVETDQMKALGTNVRFVLVGEVLVLAIDLTARQGRSASGKNAIIATTSGNVEVPGHPGAKLGVNCYTK